MVFQSLHYSVITNHRLGFQSLITNNYGVNTENTQNQTIIYSNPNWIQTMGKDGHNIFYLMTNQMKGEGEW